MARLLDGDASAAAPGTSGRCPTPASSVADIVDAVRAHSFRSSRSRFGPDDSGRHESGLLQLEFVQGDDQARLAPAMGEEMLERTIAWYSAFHHQRPGNFGGSAGRL